MRLDKVITIEEDDKLTFRLFNLQFIYHYIVFGVNKTPSLYRILRFSLHIVLKLFFSIISIPYIYLFFKRTYVTYEPTNLDHGICKRVWMLLFSVHLIVNIVIYT